MQVKRRALWEWYISPWSCKLYVVEPTVEETVSSNTRLSMLKLAIIIGGTSVNVVILCILHATPFDLHLGQAFTYLSR
jgi:hypothetical protein